MATQLIISGAVGVGGRNRPDDVLQIQQALNSIPPDSGGPSVPLDLDGLTGPMTNGAIGRFQKHHFGWADSRVDPDKVTIQKLRELLGGSSGRFPVVMGLAGGGSPNPSVLIPISVPTPGLPAATGDRFAIDLVGWIPQPEVDNPLHQLPGAVQSLLPSGVCDPFFGGDNFTTPWSVPIGMSPPVRTFRAKQHLDFTFPIWGDTPTVGTSKTTPGITTCLSDTRAKGGKVTFSLTATAKKSSASVTFSKSDNWYEVKMSGTVLDPVPTAAATALTARIPGLSSLPGISTAINAAVKQITDMATPSLTWDFTLRIQQGTTIDKITEASYLLFTGAETSSTLSFAKTAVGSGSSNLVHGRMTFSMWPSAVIYLTYTPAGGTAESQPILFSDGSTRPKPETAFIVVPKLCKLRQIKW